MNNVVHFEMPYGDRDRMAKFYESNFGWEYNFLGEEMGNYVVAMTTESDEKGPLKPGAINGGFYPKSPDNPLPGPSFVIAVEDLEESMQKVKQTGGKVVSESITIPGIGKYVIFEDTEGNRLSMLEPEEAGESDRPD